MPIDDNDVVKKIHAQEALSGLVSYGEAVVLHESKKTRVTFIPFYIPRSYGRDLAIKIITYIRRPDSPSWALVEEKSISLKESAARKLLNSLQEHLAVAADGENGDFILIRETGGVASVSGHSTATIAETLMQILQKEDLVQHLAGLELGDEIITSLRGAIKLKELRSAMAQLRHLLDSGVVLEDKYQEWCSAHSWAFGNAYVTCDETRSISAGDNIDLLLPSALTGCRDIIELKRPDMEVLVYDKGHKNYYFSSEVSKAIGQCHRYLDVFQEVATHGLRDHPEIVAYHPRAIIVIGRSDKWTKEMLGALHGLNSRLSGISVMTYDQLFTQGERIIQILDPEDGTKSFVEDECDVDIPDYL